MKGFGVACTEELIYLRRKQYFFEVDLSNKDGVILASGSIEFTVASSFLSVFSREW